MTDKAGEAPPGGSSQKAGELEIIRLESEISRCFKVMNTLPENDSIKEALEDRILHLRMQVHTIKGGLNVGR